MRRLTPLLESSTVESWCLFSFGSESSWSFISCISILNEESPVMLLLMSEWTKKGLLNVIGFIVTLVIYISLIDSGFESIWGIESFVTISSRDSSSLYGCSISGILFFSNTFDDLCFSGDFANSWLVLSALTMLSTFLLTLSYILVLLLFKPLRL